MQASQIRRPVNTPAPRCLHCKAVLSPEWSQCQICHRAIAAPHNTDAHVESRIRPGDDVVFWHEEKEGLQTGRVHTPPPSSTAASS